MGKATTLIGICLMVSIVATLAALGLQAVDPASPILASNVLFGDFNLVYPQMNTTGTWTNPNDYGTYMPTRETTGGKGGSATNTDIKYPDWTYSGLQWILGVGSMFVNVIGAPYTLAVLISPTSAGAVIGTGFALLNMFIIVGWILGKID